MLVFDFLTGHFHLLVELLLLEDVINGRNQPDDHQSRQKKTGCDVLQNTSEDCDLHRARTLHERPLWPDRIHKRGCNRDELHQRFGKVHPSLRPKHTLKAFYRIQLGQFRLHLFSRPCRTVLDEVTAERRQSQNAKHNCRRRRQCPDQRSCQLHCAALLKAKSVRVIHQANQRARNHAQNWSRRSDQQRYTHHHEPDRHVLTSDGITFLSGVV